MKLVNLRFFLLFLHKSPFLIFLSLTALIHSFTLYQPYSFFFYVPLFVSLSPSFLFLSFYNALRSVTVFSFLVLISIVSVSFYLSAFAFHFSVALYFFLCFQSFTVYFKIFFYFFLSTYLLCFLLFYVA